MQQYDKVSRDGIPGPEIGRELAEEELVAIHGGAGSNNTSTLLPSLNNLPSLPNLPGLSSLPGVTNIGQITGLLGMGSLGNTSSTTNTTAGSSVLSPSLATISELTGLGGIL